jgi:hypothetical protein
MSEQGPFKIVTKKEGIQYRHTLMLYSACCGFKVSPSPIAPLWMRQRQATGNTAYFLDGMYKRVHESVKPQRRSSGVITQSRPRAAT